MGLSLNKKCILSFVITHAGKVATNRSISQLDEKWGVGDKLSRIKYCMKGNMPDSYILSSTLKKRFVGCHAQNQPIFGLQK